MKVQLVRSHFSSLAIAGVTGDEESPVQLFANIETSEASWQTVYDGGRKDHLHPDAIIAAVLLGQDFFAYPTVVIEDWHTGERDYWQSTGIDMASVNLDPKEFLEGIECSAFSGEINPPSPWRRIERSDIMSEVQRTLDRAVKAVKGSYGQGADFFR